MRSLEHTQAQSKTERQGEAQMSKQGRGAGRLARLTMVLGAAVAALAMSAPLAQAAFGVTGFENDVVNADGSAASQAGGHPYSVSANISFSEIPGPGYPLPDESIRNVSVDLPAGFVGSTTAALKCSTADLFGVTTRAQCPLGSQVGMLEVEGTLLGTFQTEISPLYNVEAPPGVPASFGANVLGTLVYLNASIRSDSDYGVTVMVRNASQTMPIVRTKATFWGVPADPSHDIQRCLFPTFNLGVCDNTWQGDDPHYNNPNPAGIAAKPLLTNLSNCDGQPFVTKLWAESWAGSTDSATHTLEDGGNPVAIKGCDKVPFEPMMSVVPESREAGAPTGIEASISGLQPVAGCAACHSLLGVPRHRSPASAPTAPSRTIRRMRRRMRSLRSSVSGKRPRSSRSRNHAPAWATSALTPCERRPASRASSASRWASS